MHKLREMELNTTNVYNKKCSLAEFDHGVGFSWYMKRDFYFKWGIPTYLLCHFKLIFVMNLISFDTAGK